jgi:hypothetical protein
MLSKGIDTTIRELIEQLPKGGTGTGPNPGDFEKLIAPLAEKISAAILEAAASTSTPASTTGAGAPSVGPSPQSRLNPFQLSLLRDRESPLLQQLSNDLVAGDPQYNQREGTLRDRLDLNGIERRLQDAARALDVSYDRSDLDGILRNSGYDATHLGSSERYMAAIEKYIGEAEKNYRQRAGNTPGQLA